MQKAFDLIEKYGMIESGDKIIVGVSGGADSLCLLFVLLDYQRRVPFSLLAVHVEHGIRGQESLGDARFVEELCKKLRVACRTVSCDVPALAAAQSLTVEEAARMARYEAFDRVGRETGANKIAVAHSRDDQAETILFRMARGSGLEGACGMRPVRGNIIRPLLACGRSEIEEYLTKRGISWRTDSTNADMDYARNRLRRRVLPALRDEVNAAADAHLAALGGELQQVRDYLIKAAREATGRIAEFKPDSVRIHVEEFLRLDEALQPYCLRECFSGAGCGLKDISRVHIESVQGLFSMQSGREITLPGGWKAAREFGQVIIRKKRGQGEPGYPGTDRGQGEPGYPGTGRGQGEPGYPGTDRGQGGPEQPAGEEGRAPVRVTAPGVCRFAGDWFSFQVFPYKNENILKKTYTKWFDYDKINNSLFLRTRHTGDYLVIGGEGQRKKLKQYLIEEKVPQTQRDDVPLLACGSEILWVVGHRISESYKVTSATKTVLEVQKMGGYDGGESDGNDTGGRGGQKD